MKRFVALQFDGLSYRKLMEASHKGYCPFLTSLMKKGYNVSRYNCGLPSNTPFAQAGIMYGHNEQIPGFTFVDKRMKLELKIRNPVHTYIMEKEYLSKHKGILLNGMSYVNLFSGGANYSRLTTSTLYNKRLYLKQLDPMLMLLNPLVLTKVLYNGLRSSVSVLDYLYEKFCGTVSKLSGASDFKYNLTRLFSSVLFEELETQAVIKSMKKGTPRIYATYNGYDENSHHQGPASPAAFQSIKAIDARIRKIFENKSDYDIYILSDHGHTESVPFKSLYGQSFHKYVEHEMSRYEHKHKPHHLEKEMLLATGVKRSMLRPFSRLEKGFHRCMVKNFGFKRLHWNSHPYFLEVSDDLAHIYINSTMQKMDYEELEQDYPGLLDGFARHPGIGLVICKDKDSVKVMNKDGEVVIGSKSDHRFKGRRFLKDYGNEGVLCEQIAYLARMRNSGDIILMGDYSKHDVVSFINHYGSHGSAGGEQMHPFFISEKKHNLSGVKNVKELYDIFIGYQR